MDITQDSQIWHTRIDTSGRVLLPVELRETIEATPGMSLVWSRTPDGLKLQSSEELLESIQSYFLNLAPEDEVWSEELLKERAEEAARE